MKIATTREAATTESAVRPGNSIARLVQRCGCGGGDRDRDTAGSAATPVMRAARPSTVPVSNALAPAVVGRALQRPGRSLDAGLATRFGATLGADLSGVVLHTDCLAAESANAISASAYTVGNHIAFGPGSYAPHTHTGQRLLLHELVHVAQAGAGGAGGAGATGPLTLGGPDSAAEHQARHVVANADLAATQSFSPAAPRTVRRQPKDAGAPPPQQPQQFQQPPQQAAPGSATLHIVVRDPGLNLGGGALVSDLEAAKARMTTKQEVGGWTLVLSIHASEDRLGAQSPPDWQKNAKFYDVSAVNSLFGGDAAFVTWRDKFGPSRVVLYGCQVSAQFEQTIDNNLVRGGTGPTAKGLGPGCHPIADIRNFGVKTRAEFTKLAADEQTKMTQEVQDVNTTWGYYGGPPVPADKVLDYLFDGPGKGTWACVEVQVLNKSTNDYESMKPPIPFWNRQSNSVFLRSCNPIVLTGTHTPAAPAVP